MTLSRTASVTEIVEHVELSAKQLTDKFNTAWVSPAMAQILVNDLAKRKAEKTGELFDCYVRYCPVDPKDPITAPKNYDMQQLTDFVESLKEIQQEMLVDPDIPPRRMQLMLNFNEAHWTAIDFQVSKDGIKCFLADAAEYATLMPEIKALSQVLPANNIFLAFGYDAKEKLQQFRTCFTFAEDLTRKCANQPELFERLSERATHHGGHAKEYEAIAKGLNVVAWTSLTPSMNWMSESPNESLMMYMRRNPLQATQPTNLAGETYAERISDNVVPIKDELINKAVLRYTNKIAKRLLDLAGNIKSSDEADYLAKAPLKYSDYLNKVKECNNMLLDKYVEVRGNLDSADPDIKESAEEFLVNVARASGPRNVHELWGHLPPKYNTLAVREEVLNEVMLLQDRSYSPKITAAMYAYVIEGILNECQNSTYSQINEVIDKIKFDGSENYGFDIADDPGLGKHLDAFIKSIYEKFGDIDNTSRSSGLAHDLLKKLVSELIIFHGIYKTEAEELQKEIAAGATVADVLPFDPNQFSELKLELCHIAIAEMAKPDYRPDDFIGEITKIGASSEDMHQNYLNLVSLILSQDFDSASPHVKKMLMAVVESNEIKLDSESRTVNSVLKIAQDWREDQKQQLTQTVAARPSSPTPGN